MISFSINKTDEEVFDATRVALGSQKGKYSSRGKEWQSEVIFAYLEGRVAGDYVNVEGFAVRCEENTNFAKWSREDNFIDNAEWQRGFKGVTDTSHYSGSTRQEKNEVDNLIDKLVQDEEEEAAIAEFEELYDEVAVEHGVNLKTLIKKALQTGYARYINRVSEIVKEYGKEGLMEFILRNEKLCNVLELKDEEAPNITFEGGEQIEVGYANLGRKYFIHAGERIKQVV
ncbi:hypothetical protein [Paenibacillus sp. EPM92]|uniref:hypothetical protein n=1 Tax=Paenibacillus sp. EPM92 TaxID=1561195 RepID=UPI001916912C|nr:hypothetical protein [Paenibacillus sp. EPM92]